MSLLNQAISYLPTPVQTWAPTYWHHLTTHPRPGYIPFFQVAEVPAHIVGQMFLWVTAGVYFLGVITGNVSQVDRLWTFLPPLYSLHFGLYPIFNENGPKYAHNLPRVWLMIGLQLVWSSRLSYNAFRRGFMNFKDEDYRWPIWRAKVPGWVFAVFHLVFIAIIQNILLLMLALPVQIALITPASAQISSILPLPFGLTHWDLFLTLSTLTGIYIQWCADNQQWSFQNFKHSLLSPNTPNSLYSVPKDLTRWRMEGGLAEINWSKEDAERGFVTRGLWSWSRHPNCAAEMWMWFMQGLFPTLTTVGGMALGKDAKWKEGMGIGHPLFAPLALSFLFVASTDFTEKISAGKYPKYKAYQSLVGEFLPQATILRGLALRVLGKRERLAAEVWGNVNADGGVNGKKVEGKKDL